MKKFIILFSYLFIIFSIIPFLPEAVFYIKSNMYVNHHFDLNYTSSLPGIFNFKYVKDVLMIILLILLNVDLLNNFTKSKYKIIKFYIVSMLVVVYGILTSVFFFNNFDIMQFASGIRPIMLLLLSIQMGEYILRNSLLSYIKIILILLYFEFFIIILQYLIFIEYFGVVNPVSIRLIGTFGGIANVAYFALSVAITLLIVESKRIEKSSFKKTVFNLLICILVSAFSGTRAALICCLLIFIIYLLNFNTKLFTKKIQYLLLSFSVSIIFIILGLIELASTLSGRGSMISQQVSGGRIDFFLTFFEESSMLQIIFGKGLGVGTNTALLLNERIGFDINSKIMDGTFNVILMQFGLFVLLIVIFIYIIWFVYIMKHANGNFLLGLTIFLTNTIMCLTMNILELFAYLPFFVISYFIYIADKSYFIKLNNMKKIKDFSHIE